MRLQESTLFNNGGNGMKKLVTLLLSLALVLSLAACGGEATPDASDDAPLLLKMKKAPKTTTPKIKSYLRKLLPLTTQSVR